MGFQRQKRRWVIGAAVGALLGVFALHHAAGTRTLGTGDLLTTLPLYSLDGASSEARTAGRAQIINIFATWCPPCRQEMPAIEHLAFQLKSRAVDVVGIDQQESGAAVKRFSQDFHISYALYIDRANVTHDRLGARIIPTTIFVDAQGVIRWERSGPLSADDLRSLGGAIASVQ